MSPDVPTWIRYLRFLYASTLLVQTAIILACVAIGYANAEAGFLRFRLPPFLFWAYVWVGIGAPGVALATLVVLWAKRSSLWIGASITNKRTLRWLIVLCLVNVCAIAVWFVFGGLVFLGAGGVR